MDYYRINERTTLLHVQSQLSGLTPNEVILRREKYGKNSIEIKKSISFWKLVLRQFRNYLVWLLLFVSGFAFFSGIYFHAQEQLINGVIILGIVFINGFVGAYQDYKSEKSAELLKTMLRTEAMVTRDGKQEIVDAQELVLGDIIDLVEGDKVPADCRLLSAENFKVDESTLTGESSAVTKKCGLISREVPLAERTNMVFMNTYVTRGKATCVVIGAGKSTEVGKIAKSLEQESKSLFLDEVDNASKRITYVAISFILIAMAVLYMNENSWVSVFLIGSALIIGSIPEGLPAIVTFSLSLASMRLAKKHVLVKQKSVLETLGSVDVICTDKTGTLTENQMSVKKIWVDGCASASYDKLSKQAQTHFRNCSILCNEVKDTEKGLVGDAEDIALIDYLNQFQIDIFKIRENHPYIAFEPFSSETKFARSTNEFGKKKVIYTKGAPEVILAQCTKYLNKGKVLVLSEKSKATILSALKEFSMDALRNIALSYALDAKNQVFIGFVGIYDKPKKHVAQTIETLYGAGIDVKMITGDNQETAMAMARECGFRNIKAISWNELKDLSTIQLRKSVEECNVFARMSPEYKLKIVAALQENGKRVAITGDGVNDVPALKKADVGIAMGKRGSAIAKEAAELILLDDDLSSILISIKEGRTIFSNIRKVINYLLTANLSEVLVVFAGSLMGLVPILAIQLLWVNFITDIAPAMALGVDPPHSAIMNKQPTGKNEKLINERITLLTLFIGLKKFIIMFLLFIITYKFTQNLMLAQTFSFTWLVLSHFVRIVTIRFDEGRNLFINKYLNWSLVAPLLLHLIILYTPLSRYFQIIPLGLLDWFVIIIAVSTAIILALIITKFIDNHLPRSNRDC